MLHLQSRSVMGYHRFVTAYLLLLSLQTAWALYQPGGPVKLLTSKNFHSAVIESDVPAVGYLSLGSAGFCGIQSSTGGGIRDRQANCRATHIVEFFAPWCGHCQQLAPTYMRVADNLHGLVTVGAVDCDAESNKGLCAQYGIRGFPTLKLFPADKQKRGKRLSKTPEDYNGPRSAKAIAEAGTAGLTAAFVQRPKTETDFATFKTSSTLPKVVLFTDKSKTSTLYKSLSMRFRGRLSFAEVRDPKGQLATAYGVNSAPTLFVLPMGDGEPVTYEGKLKAKDLVVFLKPFAGSKDASGKDASKSSAKADKVEKPFAETQPEKKAKVEEPEPVSTADALAAIDDLALSDVDRILEQDDVWLLGIYRGSSEAECSEEGVAFGKLVNELGSLVKAGRLNATGMVQAQLSERGIDVSAKDGCAHTLLLKPFGEQSEPEEPFPVFSGETKAKALQTFVLGGYPSDAIPRLTKASVGAFMAGDLASARVPKVLLFTNKADTPPLFAALAANTRDLGLAFAAVHETETEVLDDFKVTKVPAMLFAWSEEVEDKKDQQGHPMIGTKLQPFPGPFRYAKMLDFVHLMTSLASSRTGDQAASLPTLQQANSTVDYRELCGDKLGLCIIGVMNPAVSDHAERLNTLRAVAMKRSGQALHFLWVDARQQKDFLAAFSLQPGDAPTAIVLSPRKKRFAVLQGALEPQQLHELLEGLLAGRQRTSTVDEIPGLAVAAAEGATADTPAAEPAADAEEPIEEEFDLSDIMDEEIEGAGSGGTKAERLEQIEAQLQAEAEEKKRQEDAAAAEAQKQAAAARAAAAAKAAERIRQKKAAAAAAAKEHGGSDAGTATETVKDEL